MNNNLIAGALAFFAARSPRFRKLVPFIPIALGALALYKSHRDGSLQRTRFAPAAAR